MNHDDDEYLRGTIPFEDVDIIQESDDLEELLEFVEADQSIETLYGTIPGSLSHRPIDPAELEKTISREVPLDVARAARHLVERRQRPRRRRQDSHEHDRTQVRKIRQSHEEATVVQTLDELKAGAASQEHWADCHAVVDEKGRLQLPNQLAARLEPGTVIEIRIARHFLDD